MWWGQNFDYWKLRLLSSTSQPTSAEGKPAKFPRSYSVIKGLKYYKLLVGICVSDFITGIEDLLVPLNELCREND